MQRSLQRPTKAGHFRATSLLFFVALCLASSSCSTTRPVALKETAETSESKAFLPPRDLAWFRHSAERQANQAQAYRYARERVDSSRPTQGRWAIVLDADETVLDNTAYQERVAKGILEKWEQSTWDAWVNEEKSPPFPAAKQYLLELRRQHPEALIALVTNRSETTCSATAAVLRKQGVPYDAILCAALKPDGKLDSNKEPRFAQVASGAAFKLTEPVKVVLFIGDNIKDCPGQTQQNYDLSRFGGDCIVLPNPMYGDWERTPYVPVEP